MDLTRLTDDEILGELGREEPELPSGHEPFVDTQGAPPDQGQRPRPWTIGAGPTAASPRDWISCTPYDPLSSSRARTSHSGDGIDPPTSWVCSDRSCSPSS